MIVDCEKYLSYQSSVLSLFSSGVDFKMKTLEIDGIKVRIQIWYVRGCVSVLEIV